MIEKDLIIQLQQEQLDQQKKIIAGLSAIISNNENIIDKLNALVELLKARVDELENNQKKDSSNSSKPPSSDISKPPRTQSLRMASGKKPGGQKGHTGDTLSFNATPDEVVVHTVKQCRCCGKSLRSIQSADYERRQVYDIPPIKMLVTEHRGEIKNCPHCQTANRAVFPETISQPVQYGSNVAQLAVYFTQYQLLPYGRTSEIFKDLFGHSLSSSFLVNNNRRCADKLQPFITDLKAQLLKQPVLHADETGYYFEGQRNWLHTLCTDRYTYYAVHTKRGAEAMNDMGVLPNYTGRLVHDYWKSYYEFDNCKHRLCNTHHLRDLTFCHQVEASSWAGQIKKLLIDLLDKVWVTKNQDASATSLSKGQLQYWESKYDKLMKEGQCLHPPPEKQKGKRGVTKKSKTQNMLERFINCKDQILDFAKDFQTPFSNNLAEQAIRMMKIKQKISGCFRSMQGAKDFADIRSYIATAKKQGVDIMDALKAAITGQPLELKA